MSLKLVQRVDPVERQSYESPVDADAALVDENGAAAFGTAGAVAALSALTVAQVTAVGALTAAEIAALDFSSIQAVVATDTGATTGTITAKGLLNICTVNPDSDANHIVILPAPVPGTIVVLLNTAATAYELRSSDPATIAINGGTGSGVESAIPASSIAILVCRAATAWHGLSITAATLAAIEAAA